MDKGERGLPRPHTGGSCIETDETCPQSCSVCICGLMYSPVYKQQSVDELVLHYMMGLCVWNSLQLCGSSFSPYNQERRLKTYFLRH